MNSTLKATAIAAAAMVGVGILFAGIGFMAGGNQAIYLDQDGFHAAKDDKAGGNLEAFQQDTSSFNSIDVDLDYYDVDLIPSDKFFIEGKFFSREGKPDVKVENGVLTAREKNIGGIKINIDMPGLITADNQPVLKIYYPKDTKFKDITIKCDMSDLSYEDLKADTIQLSLDSGKLEAVGISAKDITISMDSGNCTIRDAAAENKFDIENDMGKITLEGVTAKALKTTANSGDVTLTDVKADNAELNLDMGKLSGKGLDTKGITAAADSGDINLQGKLTGVTDITCDMGSVTVSPGGTKEEYSYELSSDMGSVSVGGMKSSGSVSAINGDAKNTLKISADMGSINVNFN
jgi:hypothetical protein